MASPTVLVAGASGYAGALAAAILHRHPGLDLVGVTSRSDAGVRLDELYPHHRVPLVLDAFDLDHHGTVDAAIVVGEDVPAATVLAAVRKGGGKLLESAEVFDVFRGAQVGEGRVSLAIRLVFRAPNRTLTDEETGPLVDKMLKGLGELGAERRG